MNSRGQRSLSARHQNGVESGRACVLVMFRRFSRRATSLLVDLSLQFFSSQEKKSNAETVGPHL
jgi:hypothetical protein